MSVRLACACVWVAGTIALMWTGVGRSQTPMVEFQPPEMNLPHLEGSLSLIPPFTTYMSNGGARCPDYYTHALIPPSQLGLTAQSSPVLYFHVDDRAGESPETETIVVTLQVWEPLDGGRASSMADPKDAMYESSMVLETSNLPGIVSFTVLDRVENAIGIDRVYEWELYIDCDPDGSTYWWELDRIGGWIVRTDRPELAAQLEGKTDIEKAAIYAENGIWFEALATVAGLRQENTENEEIAMAWLHLLSYGELDFLFDAPFYPVQPVDNGTIVP